MSNRSQINLGRVRALTQREPDADNTQVDRSTLSPTYLATSELARVQLPGSTRTSAISQGLAAAVGVIFFCFIAAIVIALAVSHGEPTALFLLLIIGAPGAYATYAYVRDRRREARGGALRLTQEAIVLEHAALLSDPLIVPLDQLRKAAVDDGRRWGERAGMFRFPVYDIRHDGSGTREMLGPLWDADRRYVKPGSTLPILDTESGRTPNVALVFEDPITASGVQEKDHTPLEGEAMAGLLLHVADPAEARQALATARVPVADIDRDDLEILGSVLTPAEGEAPARGRPRSELLQQRWIKHGVGALALGLFVPFFALWTVVNGFMLHREGRRVVGAFFVIAGLMVFFGRLAIWLG